MSLEAVEQQKSQGIAPGHRQFRWSSLHRLWRRPSFGLAVLYLIVLVTVAILAPFIAPHNPLAQDLANPLAPFSAEHPLGTDDLGRDELSRLLWGARPTIGGAVIALGTACLLGLPWGLIAGYVGGWPDNVLMRIADAILVFPGVVLALALVSMLGPSLVSTMVALGIVFSPSLARVTRVGVLSVQYKEYVAITRMFGLSAWHRVIHHVLPNVLPGVMVQLTLMSGLTILVQTGLNFLGLGVPNPNPSWGSSVAETFRYIVVDPYAPLLPGLLIVITVIAVYRIGDELRDLLDVSV